MEGVPFLLVGSCCFTVVVGIIDLIQNSVVPVFTYALFAHGVPFLLWGYRLNSEFLSFYRCLYTFCFWMLRILTIFSVGFIDLARKRMATTQLAASSISAKGFASFEGLRSTSNFKAVSFAPLKKNSRSFRGLIVKAATVVSPKVYNLVSFLCSSCFIPLFCSNSLSFHTGSRSISLPLSIVSCTSVIALCCCNLCSFFQNALP